MGYIKAPPYDHDHENEVQLFAETNHRNRPIRFGIKTDDRRRHVYVIGKSGMGKSVLLENMFLSDIHAGHGCCYIDPHGDTADRFLDYIPPHRINDVVYFSPADMEYPIGFNILESVDPDKKHLVAGGLMSVFKKIWPDVWSARMEYILINTILALLDVPGATLLGINRLYVDEDYRKKVISLIQDPVVKTFWVKEFAAFTEKYRTEAVAPVQNKVGQFLSSSIVRNIVAQSKSTIDFREIMDSRKILILNLSKGLIGESNMALLGNMIITRLQLAAMERVNMPEKERQDFFLYVDEFQNFATESFASILSEARKYRLGLVVAHQYVEQLSEEVKAAVFGNVGTMISFRVGGPDAVELEKEFAPTYLQEDLISLTKYTIYLRLLIDGVASTPFSAKTLPPISSAFPNREKVVKVSRERYATAKAKVESNVIKWSGFGTADAGGKIATDEENEDAAAAEVDVEEEKIEERIKELQASSPYVGEMAKSADGGGFGGKKEKKKPAFTVPCSVCNEPQELSFEPDWSKPWFCKNHLEMRNTPGSRRLPTLAKLTGRDPQTGKLLSEAGGDAGAEATDDKDEAPKREVIVVLPKPAAAAPAPQPPRREVQRIVVLPKPAPQAAPPQPAAAATAVAERPSEAQPATDVSAAGAPPVTGASSENVANMPAQRPRTEKRPAPPPLASGKPRIVISTAAESVSDADELRAAVTKPAREKEKETEAPALTSPVVERELREPAKVELISDNCESSPSVAPVVVAAAEPVPVVAPVKAVEPIKAVAPAAPLAPAAPAAPVKPQVEVIKVLPPVKTERQETKPGERREMRPAAQSKPNVAKIVVLPGKNGQGSAAPRRDERPNQTPRPPQHRADEPREAQRNGPPALGQGKIRIVADQPAPASAPAPAPTPVSPTTAPVVAPAIAPTAPAPTPAPVVPKPAPMPAPAPMPMPMPSPAPAPAPKPTTAPAPVVPTTPPPTPSSDSKAVWQPGQVIKF
jgi:hypothetical protein